MKQISITVFRKWVSTDESTFEMVSQCRHFVRPPGDPVETSITPQYLVKEGCKGRFKKIMVWGRYGRPACVC